MRKHHVYRMLRLGWGMARLGKAGYGEGFFSGKLIQESAFRCKGIMSSGLLRLGMVCQDSARSGTG